MSKRLRFSLIALSALALALLVSPSGDLLTLFFHTAIIAAVFFAAWHLLPMARKKH